MKSADDTPVAPSKHSPCLQAVASFLLVFYGDAVCFRPSSESFGNDDRAILPRCATPSLRVAAVSLHDRNFSSGNLRENLPEMPHSHGHGAEDSAL